MSAIENRIYTALVALTNRCKVDSFVIIEEPESGKFVQFGRGPDLEIDVPCISLTGVEVENASQFFESLGEPYYPRKNYVRDKNGKATTQLSFNHNFGHDAHAAAKAVVESFWAIYGISKAELSIKEN